MCSLFKFISLTHVQNDGNTTKIIIHVQRVNWGYILEEIGSYENLDDIDIMLDAKHGWRENANDSNVTNKIATLLSHYQKGRHCFTTAWV